MIPEVIRRRQTVRTTLPHNESTEEGWFRQWKDEAMFPQFLWIINYVGKGVTWRIPSHSQRHPSFFPPPPVLFPNGVPR